MADYDINTLKFNKGDLVTVDKLNFLVDFVRNLIPKPQTIVDLNGRLPIYLPSGGTWMYCAFYLVDNVFNTLQGEGWTYNPVKYFSNWEPKCIYGSITEVKKGGSKIWDTFQSEAYRNVYVEGFAWKISEK